MTSDMSLNLIAVIPYCSNTDSWMHLFFLLGEYKKKPLWYSIQAVVCNHSIKGDLKINLRLASANVLTDQQSPMLADRPEHADSVCNNNKLNIDKKCVVHRIRKWKITCNARKEYLDKNSQFNRCFFKVNTEQKTECRNYLANQWNENTRFALAMPIAPGTDKQYDKYRHSAVECAFPTIH